jgi:stage II sporulation protein D
MRVGLATILAVLAACGAPTRPTPEAARAPRPEHAPPTAPIEPPAAPAPALKSSAPSAPAPAPQRARGLPSLPATIELQAAGGPQRLALDDYLCGVLRGELVVWDAPNALLEAQAIASRSYALAVLELRALQGRSSALSASTAAQAYRAPPQGTLSPAARKVEQRVRAAVLATRGRVLAADERVLDARFHASCGGSTAAFADVFADQQDLGAMPSVACSGCGADSAWKVTLQRGELARAWDVLGLSPKDWTLAPARRDARGRWLEVELGSKGKSRRLPFEEFRARIGAARIPSSRITNEWPAAGKLIDATLVLEGRGRGHGVGMCQVGARKEAERGASAAAILTRYYPGAVLATLR